MDRVRLTVASTTPFVPAPHHASVTGGAAFEHF
jgi:hypothetical protein